MLENSSLNRRHHSFANLFLMVFELLSDFGAQLLDTDRMG